MLWLFILKFFSIQITLIDDVKIKNSGNKKSLKGYNKLSALRLALKKSHQ